MTGRFYDTRAWRTLRSELLDLYPVCENCNRAPSTEIHDRSARPGREHSLDPADLQALCNSCHKAMHRRFGRRSKPRTPRS